MRIIIVCGNPECDEEYNADSNDSLFKCPHCGREKENPYYPFLTAKLMQAKSMPAEADWKALHDELLEKAKRTAFDLRERASFLEEDIRKLRRRLPEGTVVKPADLSEAAVGGGFIDGWSPSDPEDRPGGWKRLHDELLSGARAEVLYLERKVPRLEDELRRVKSALGIS
jgi:hypothetical protein